MVIYRQEVRVPLLSSGGGKPVVPTGRARKMPRHTAEARARATGGTTIGMQVDRGMDKPKEVRSGLTGPMKTSSAKKKKA